MFVARRIADGVSFMHRSAATVALQAYESAVLGWPLCKMKTELCWVSLVYALNMTVSVSSANFHMVRPDSTCDQTDDERIARGAPNRTRVLQWMRNTPCVRHALDGTALRVLQGPTARHPAKSTNTTCRLNMGEGARIRAEELFYPWCQGRCARQHGLDPPQPEKVRPYLSNYSSVLTSTKRPQPSEWR